MDLRGFGAAACMSVALPVVAAGQIVHDGSVGAPGALTGPDYEIPASRGATAGRNLFHSFESFSVGRGERATFTGPAGIDNVVSRVTGGAPSTIDGPVRSLVPGADFWFANPAGVVVGERGTFDVPAGLHVGAANEIRFADGARFRADSGAGLTLTAASPESFGFTGAGAGALRLEGTTLSLPGDGEFVGGEVALDGARVFAEAPADLALSGGSISVERSLVALDNTGGGPAGVLRLEADSIRVVDSEVSALGFGEGPAPALDIRAGDLMLDGGALLLTDAFDDGDGGDIDIAATRFFASERSAVITSTQGPGRGGDLRVRVTDELSLDDAVFRTLTFASGDAGALDISGADVFAIRNEGRVFTGVLAPPAFSGVSGSGGAIAIDVGAFVIDGATDHRPTVATGVSAPAQRGTSGDAGPIRVSADSLAILNGGAITSGVQSNAAGRGGDITLDIDGELLIEGFSDALGLDSGVFATTAGWFPEARAGDIRIRAGEIVMRDFAAVVANAGGVARAGDIDLSIRGPATLTDNAFVGAETSGAGDGGDIDLVATALLLSDGGLISAGPGRFATGDGGDISVDVGALTIDGGESFGGRGTGLTSTAGSQTTGAAGDIAVTARTVDLVRGGFIESSANGGGPGGGVRVTATGHVVIDGRAGIGARTVSTAPGARGGSVAVETPRLLIRDVGFVSASSRGGAPGGSIVLRVADEMIVDGAAVTAEALGSGDAGDIEIVAGRLTLLDQGGISAGSRAFGPDPSGRGGDVVIRAGDVVLDGTMAADPAASRPNISSSARFFTTGDAGTVRLFVDDLTLRQAEIGSLTQGTGSGGAVEIEATGIVSLSGPLAFVVTSTTGPAPGGAIGLSAREVRIEDGASITAAASGSGDAGSILVRGAERVVLRDGSIVTDAAEAGGGRITVIARDRVDLRESRIESSVAGADDTTAGDILVDPDFVILDESAILAQATAGSGGNIRIRAGTLIVSAGSRVDATAETGIDGTVTTGSPAEDVSARLAQLPADFQERDALLREGCDRRDIRDASTFQLGGAGASAGPLIAGYDIGDGKSGSAPATAPPSASCLELDSR